MSEQVFTPALQPELPPTPEQQSESPKIEKLTQQPSTQDRSVSLSDQPTAGGPVLPKNKNPQLIEIESILSDGLDQAYISLTMAKRQEFRAQGEILAHTLQIMLERGKINIKKIRRLIMKWLRVIPGVNRYFLEQEAKIKSDRLVELALEKK